VSAAVQQAVVLAAGRGSRMGPLTDEVPKCLLPLAGRPVLAWTLDALRANGCTRVQAVGGWCHARLRPWVDDLVLNPRWSETNMVRSLQAASHWLAQAPTLVVYGDGAYGRRALAQALAATPYDLVVPVDLAWESLWRRRFAQALDDAECLRMQGDRLLRIGQRPASFDDVQAQFMGLLCMTPAGWDRVSSWLARYERIHGASAVDRMDTTTLLSRMLDSAEPVHCVPVRGGWVEIDADSDLQLAEQALAEPEWMHDFRV
jgi:choline kinase